MLQNQYYSHKLTNSQIEKILKNYDIKYITMKNEIDAKFNILIKEFVIDIKKFLDKNEEFVNERKKIKEAENVKMEIEILKSKLDEKELNNNKLQSEIDNLTKENISLKKRIKIQTNIAKSKKAITNSNELNSTNSSILKSESRSIKNRYKKFYNTQQNKDISNKDNKDKKNYKTNIIKTDTNKNNKNIKKRNNNHLSNSIEKRTLKDVENLKSASVKYKINHSNSTGKRNINNFKNISTISNNKKIKNKNKKNISINKTPESKSMTVNITGDISSSHLNSKNNKTIENEKKMDLSEINPFDQSLEEDDSMLTVDDVIDEEIKELEMDEENIILLMEQIKNFKSDNENNGELN